MTVAEAAAKRTGNRIEAVDLARGIALLAMMFVHIGPRWTGENPPFGDMLAGGRAAPLFALLAGVALTIVHERDPEGAGSTRATWIRAFFLIILGLILGSLDQVPVYVILVFYGFMIFAALPFRRLSTPWLLALAGVWAIVAPVIVLWAQMIHAPVEEGQVDFEDVQNLGELVMEVLVWGAYPAAVWFAFILVGLAIGRLDLRSAAVAWRLVVIGGVTVAATMAAGLAAISAGVFDGRLDGGWRILFGRSLYPFEPSEWEDLLMVGQHTSQPLWVLSSIGSAVLVIGLCALIMRLPWSRWATLPIRAAGAMTLTLYTVHVLWAWRIRVNFMDDSPGELQPHTYGTWLLQVVVLCAAATLWALLVGKGPLEWLVRRVSVRKRKKPEPIEV